MLVKMLFTCRLSALLTLLSSTLPLTLARPQFFPRPAGDAFTLSIPTIPNFNCAPNVITATHITTSILDASHATVLTVNRVQTVPYSCYIATITATPDNCPFNTATCTETPCLIASTTTVPCVDLCCSTTPTVTSTMPCQTACGLGCATNMTTATPTSCPVVP